MLFLIVLAVATAVAVLVHRLRRRHGLSEPARVGMAAAMMFAGVSHWLMPVPFIQHVPPFIPAAEAVVLATGVVEVLLGAALLTPPPWRRRAGLLLAVYLVAVFPGNLYVALSGIDVQGQPGGWYPWARLPLQALFIAWALWSTGPPVRTRCSLQPAPPRPDGESRPPCLHPYGAPRRSSSSTRSSTRTDPGVCTAA